ncbi:hypothetical protein NIES3275_53890 [Microchaete diplosiphon NIES-3275]|nr:hypothetical protein NIES3275_53890 [Microchaete diplosiphon NIES-3275]
MGNGGNGEWGMGNGEWGMGNGEWVIDISPLLPLLPTCLLRFLRYTAHNWLHTLSGKWIGTTTPVKVTNAETNTA